MKLNFQQTIAGQSAKRLTVYLGRRLNKIMLTTAEWTLAMSLPLWLCGLGLAIGQGSVKSVGAMMLMTTISSFFFWKRIVKPLIAWKKLKGLPIGKN